ncbi:hypothetical protein Bca52824_015815 [Brassica carinata]|uniref:Uncharacterized protein n=1 Tax=Brassica carinata TaxID=52824 RepID=A0A8X8B5Z7_BRACI|nr:hypothetical protein Bca52824_015815 [Brassica carinata]
MVFPGEKEEEDYTTTATGHDTPKKTLHNFSFADLKWGAQRNLRDRGGEGEDHEGEDEQERGEREVSPPWNLRKRRAACKAPVTDSEGIQKEENGVRPKFNPTLTKKEVEDDFIAMTGHKPPRRPKKRPRNVQKQIDPLHPASYFVEVTEDLYDVPDVAENGKK